MLRSLQGAACVVIIMWAIRTASHLVVLLLLDLTFCIRPPNDPQQSGFYLIKAMAWEQAGLTGMKASIVRKVAVGKSVSSLQSSLTPIKSALEPGQ
jgi:hypothetical protein